MPRSFAEGQRVCVSPLDRKDRGGARQHASQIYGQVTVVRQIAELPLRSDAK